MKHVNFIMIAALLTLTVSCGKENKSGSKKVSSTVTNPIGSIGNIPTSNLNQSSIQAFNNYKSWYTNPNESERLERGYYGLAYGSDQGQNQNCDELFGFIPYCLNLEFDFSFNRDQLPSTCQVSIVDGNMKASNKTLARIANGTEGTLIRAQQQGPIFLLEFRKADNTFVMYTIDASRHSAFQPVAQTIITSTGAMASNEQLKQIVRNDYLQTLPACD